VSAPAPAGPPAVALAPVGAGNGAPVAVAAPPHPLGYAPQPMHPHAPRPVRAAAPVRQPSMALLYIWILLFGFVGTQLAWTLRPFFGSPGMKFSLYREINGNFYAEIFRTISHLF